VNEPPGEDPERRSGTVTRLGTARALVLLAAVLCAGAGVLGCVAAVVLGPAILDRPDRTGALVLGSVVLAVTVLLSAAVAAVLAVRARTVGAVVFRGCGLLLAGMLIGLATLLMLISRTA
jgi:hypothetical protein